MVSLLEASGVVAAGRVYSNRSLSISDDALPVVNVYTLSETSEPIDLSTSTYKRTLTLVIEVVAKSASGESIDDVIDGLLDDVEGTMADDLTLSGTALGAELVATTFENEDLAETNIGRGKLTYSTLYLY